MSFTIDFNCYFMLIMDKTILSKLNEKPFYEYIHDDINLILNAEIYRFTNRGKIIFPAFSSKSYRNLSILLFFVYLVCFYTEIFNVTTSVYDVKDF